jgi:putative metallohydrolase (TIGR04338 family)
VDKEAKMAKTKRDTQREKLYRAEKVLEKFERNLPHLEMVNLFLEDIFADPWFQKEYGSIVKTWHVKDGRRRRSACGWRQGFTACMKLPRHTRVDWIILHELAHGIQPAASAWHGPEFASIYTKLVARFMGDAAFRALTDSFREAGVRYLWLTSASSTTQPHPHAQLG